MSILKTFLSECIQNIVDSTNKYTEILLENLHFQARMNNSQRLMLSLKLTNFDGMWLYITVTLLMGIVYATISQLPNISCNFNILKTDASRQMMKRK